VSALHNKNSLIVSLSKSRIEAAKVDIFLQEGFVKDAIAVVNDLSSYNSEIIHRVMEAAISTDANSCS
jgi:uncharacterized Zn finger protein